MIHDPRNDWHVEVNHSRWTRLKRWCDSHHDIIIIVTGVILLLAILIVGPPICGAFV